MSNIPDSEEEFLVSADPSYFVTTYSPELDDYSFDPYEHRIFCRLLRRASGGRSRCFEKVSNMALACRISRTHAYRVIALLVDAKIIEKKQSSKGPYYEIVPIAKWPSYEAFNMVRNQYVPDKHTQTSTENVYSTGTDQSLTSTPIKIIPEDIPLSQKKEERVPENSPPADPILFSEGALPRPEPKVLAEQYSEQMKCLSGRSFRVATGLIRRISVITGIRKGSRVLARPEELSILLDYEWARLGGTEKETWFNPQQVVSEQNVERNLAAALEWDRAGREKLAIYKPKSTRTTIQVEEGGSARESIAAAREAFIQENGRLPSREEDVEIRGKARQNMVG